MPTSDAEDTDPQADKADPAPQNVNNSTREQLLNANISGGSHNVQYNAHEQHFHGEALPLDVELRKALFLTSPELDRSNLILTIWGSPGRGKTVLSIFLTEELERRGKAIFYFCGAEDEKRNSATSVLRGLLRHLTFKHPRLMASLRASFRRVMSG